MSTWQANYDALIEQLEGMEIIDSHEHLPSEADRVASEPDFSLFFSHYCKGDLITAGMPDVESFFGGKPLDEKWAQFEPYYLRIQDGSYCRAAHLAMERFYGLPRLTSLADAETLTKAIREANQPGLYKRVLKDACHIRVAMNFGALSDDPEYFAPVLFCAQYAEVNKAVIRGLEDSTGISCGTLNGYVDAVREEFRRFKEKGLKGVKFHFAYMRDLRFAPQAHADAERIFLRVLDEGYGWRAASLGYEESRPLQDYLVHRIVETAGELDVPVVFHTGLQAQVEHNPEDARPGHLWNLPHRYRSVKFILLHSGFPWLEDAALLAKYYPNVYLDMGWTHLMSPELSERALTAWIDLVPMNKIFGFGGDYCVVEKVHGHLVLARHDIASALATKTERGGMPLARAKAWVQALLFDNPKSVYQL